MIVVSTKQLSDFPQLSAPSSFFTADFQKSTAQPNTLLGFSLVWCGWIKQVLHNGTVSVKMNNQMDPHFQTARVLHNKNTLLLDFGLISSRPNRSSPLCIIASPFSPSTVTTRGEKEGDFFAGAGSRESSSPRAPYSLVNGGSTDLAPGHV